MPNRSEKKPRCWLQRQLPEKRHLWPPTEWPKDPCFMKLYFVMLFFILVILGSSFFIFKAGKMSNGSGMEVTIGITVGMFGILTTFAVVFFAFRAEETAVNTASEMAKLFVGSVFSKKEEELVRMLSFDTKISNHDSNNNQKEKSIYDNVDASGWQLCAWGAVFLLLLVSLYFFTHEILMNGLNSDDVLKLQILTLWIIGMLGVLIIFTVVLFAARIAQFSQIAGQIESYSIIEKLAASDERVYHELFEAHHKVIDQHSPMMNENIPLASVSRFELLQIQDSHFFDDNKIEDFGILLGEQVLPVGDRVPLDDNESKISSGVELIYNKEIPLYKWVPRSEWVPPAKRIPPSNIFSLLIACGAFLMVCFIGLDMLGKNAVISTIGGIISSSAILFTFLIFSIFVFFLGRVFRSAIALSREAAAKASYFEFEKKRIELKNWIDSIREIEKSRTLLDEEIGKLYGVGVTLSHKFSDPSVDSSSDFSECERKIIGKNMPTKQIIDILMHLLYFRKVFKKQNKKYFYRICMLIQRQFIDIKRHSWRCLLEMTVLGILGKKEDMAKMMRKARELHESVEARAHAKAEEEGVNISQLRNYYDYYEPAFLEIEKEVGKNEKKKLVKCLNARKDARNMLRRLAYMAKLCVMIKLIDSGLLLLRGNIMAPEKSEVPVNPSAERAHETTFVSPDIARYIGAVIEVLEHELSTFDKLDMYGSEPIYTDELDEVLRNFKKLWQENLEQVFRNKPQGWQATPPV